MANAKVVNKLAGKLKEKQDKRNAEFRNPYIDGKDFVTFDSFREQLENRVELCCLTKLRKHQTDEKGNYITDENGAFLWEDLFAFIDKRFPNTWSWGGSALRTIYFDLVDEDMTEEELNTALSETPLTFKLKNKKLTNGKNKGKTMVEWISE